MLTEAEWLRIRTLFRYEVKAIMAGEPPPPQWTKQIKAWRQGKGLTQEQLATMAGVKLEAIIQWEHGTQHPRWEIRKRIAQALGCAVSDLR